MKILFVPDSLWGDSSGNRSSKYLIKAFASVGIEIATYAPIQDYTEEQHQRIKKYSNNFYHKQAYNYTQQIFRQEADNEFEFVIKDFNPDFVFYVGTIKNKISIDYCIKHKIKYLYLNLTTEFYCVNTFAGTEAGSCYGCLNGSLIAPLIKKCLPADYNFISYVKDKTIEAISKKRILNAYKIVGYSDEQLNLLERFGIDRSKTLKLPIFFDPNSANGIETSTGDYFLIFGQFLTAKGFHLIPEIIKKTQDVKFKAIIKKSISKAFITDNNLEIYIENGTLEIIDFLPTHDMLLNEVAHSKGVLIPSYYPTTGEFTLVESLMLSKPVIVFDVGIHREIFTNEINGMIARVGDLHDYCKKIEELNTNTELYLRVSKGARYLFEELTSLKRFRNEISNFKRVELDKP